jgi:outer membrane protein
MPGANKRMSRMIGALAGASSLLSLSRVGAAADLPTMKPPMAPAPIADVPLSWFFKLGVIYGLNTSTSKLYSQSPAALGAGISTQFQIPGVGANIANVATLGFEAGYFVMPNISIDVSGGIPLWAKVTTKGAFAVPIPGVGSLLAPSGIELSSIAPSFIPVTILYHFMQFGQFQPYVGAGIAPVFSFKQRSAFNTGVTVDPTVGLVLQAGADIMLDRHWGWSFDVKKLFANGEAHSAGDNLAFLGVPVTAPLAGTLKTNFQPWVLSTGVDYRF